MVLLDVVEELIDEDNEEDEEGSEDNEDNEELKELAELAELADKEVTDGLVLVLDLVTRLALEVDKEEAGILDGLALGTKEVAEEVGIEELMSGRDVVAEE